MILYHNGKLDKLRNLKPKQCCFGNRGTFYPSVAQQPIWSLDRVMPDTVRPIGLAGLLWTSDQPVAETATYTKHNKHKRWTSMPSVVFELAIPAAQPSLRLYDRQDSHHFIALTQSKFTIDNGALCYRMSFSTFCNIMYEGIGQSVRLDTSFQELTSLFPILNWWLMVTKQRNLIICRCDPLYPRIQLQNTSRRELRVSIANTSHYHFLFFFPTFLNSEMFSSLSVERSKMNGPIDWHVDPRNEISSDAVSHQVKTNA